MYLALEVEKNFHKILAVVESVVGVFTTPGHLMIFPQNCKSGAVGILFLQVLIYHYSAIYNVFMAFALYIIVIHK